MRRVAFIGTDLQRDFTEPEGALFAAGAPEVLVVAERLLTHAAGREAPVVLARDTHEGDDPVFEAFPAHCVLDTPGRDLAPALGLGEVLEVPDAPQGLIEVRGGRPVVIDAPDHRRGLFGNLNADAVLDAVDAEEHVVFGTVLETGVRAAVMGLLARNRTVVLVADGVGHLDPHRASSDLAAMAGRGCHFLPLEAVLRRYA